jgi:DNA-damage-inducible protein D
MEQNHKIVLFQEKAIRRVWHKEQWYFAITDVIEILTETPQPRRYWSTLKKKILHTEGGNQLLSFMEQLKVEAADTKKYLTDVANTKGVLRIIMSVPSPKAEPFKQWLVQVGEERIEEIENPELGFERLKDIYKAKGYADDWIERRLKSIGIRKELTDEWKRRNVQEGQEYSILTAEIAKATFGLTPTEHKKVKSLDRENLRDHMTNLELIFTMLGEDVARRVSVTTDAQGFEENHEAALKGGQAAGEARERVEAISGEKVVSGDNFLTQIKEAAQKQALPPDAITDITDNSEG